LWTKDQNAAVQTKWEPLVQNQAFEKRSAEAELKDENSLLNHYKKMIHVRRSNKVLIEGEMEASFTEVEGILSFKRVTPSEQMLVIHNLTGKAKEFTLSEKESDFTDLYYKTNKNQK
jgi:alpha-amylase